MLRVFILAVLATGATAPFVDDLDARVNRGLHDAVDDLQEGGLPAVVANLAHRIIPDNPAPASSDPIRGEDDEADEAPPPSKRAPATPPPLYHIPCPPVELLSRLSV